MALRSVVGPPGHLLTLIGIASWLYDYYPTMRSYFDQPRTLEDLQEAALVQKEGYELHHIVERTPALNDGFPSEWIEGPENRVLIPTLKHWEIAVWYMRRNRQLQGLSPRHYLRGKSWDERTRLGLLASEYTGVLQW